MFDPKRGYDELKPYIGKCLKVVEGGDTDERYLSLVDEESGQALMTFYRYQVPLKRVEARFEFVVPEPLVSFATARLVGMTQAALDEGFEVEVSDAQDASWHAIPDWALTCPIDEWRKGERR